MSRRVALFSVLLALGCLAPGAGQQHGRPAPKLVQGLDAAMQARFRKLDGSVIRVAQVTDAPRHPELRSVAPRSEAERAAVNEARRAHWDVLLLVSSRSYEWVGRAYRDGAAPPGFEFWKVISPPAVLTGGQPRAVLPSQRNLLTRVPDAFQAFRKRPSYEFRTGEWYVVARPVIARQAGCIACHHKNAGDPIRIGEALAVAMYAFSPTRP